MALYNTSVKHGVNNIVGSEIPFPENPLKLYSVELLYNQSTKVWVTSDTHFNHINILKYEADKRKFADINEMNEALIAKWNAVVDIDDVVIHLGDFSFGTIDMASPIVPRLNGHIHLLKGNHDRMKKWDFDSMGFAKVYDDPFVLDDTFVLSHEPIRDIPLGMVNIYGHVHSHKDFNTIDENRMCVCVERHELTPVDFDYIKDIYDDR